MLAVARDATKLSAAAPQRATARSTEVTDRHRTSQGDHRPAPGGHDRSGLPAHTRTHPQQRRQLNTTHHRHAGERPLLTWGSLLRAFGILVHSSAVPRGLARLLGHSSRPTGALFTPSPRVSVRAIAHDYVRAGPVGELDPQHQGDPEGWPRPGEGNSADQGPDLTTSTRGGMIMPFSKKRPSGTTPEPKCRVRGAGPTPADRSRNPERHSERSPIAGACCQFGSRDPSLAATGLGECCPCRQGRSSARRQPRLAGAAQMWAFAQRASDRGQGRTAAQIRRRWQRC